MTNPAEFFETEIPAQFAAHKDSLTDEQKSVDFKVSVGLEGDGGGEWTVAFSGGDLSVGQGLAGDADVTVLSTVDNFSEALDGATGFGLAELDAETFDPSRVKPAVADRVKQIKGTLKIGMFAGTDELMGARIKFGADAPDDPTCTIAVQEEDAEMIASGKMLPQQAFMAGKIRIEGDMNLAMQVGTLQML